MNKQAVTNAVRKWVETVVIDLNLCPFAKRELIAERVRFVVSEAVTEEELLLDLQSELTVLETVPAVETTLLIHPHVLQDFADYNQCLDLFDALLQDLELQGIYQIASFHPHYQFADTQPEDAENHTNRSPYPIVHILREESLEKAVQSYPDVAQIPVRNIAVMNRLGKETLQSLLKHCLL